MSKTKVLNFNSGKRNKIMRFFFGSEELELTDEYKYLGLTLSFIKAKQNIADQVNKALFSLMKILELLNCQSIFNWTSLIKLSN